MRKYILCLALVASMIGAFSASAQFRYGPMLGIDITNLKFRQDLITVDKSVDSQRYCHRNDVSASVSV